MSKKDIVDKLVEVYVPASAGDRAFIAAHKFTVNTHYSPMYPEMDDILTARHFNTYVRSEHGRNHPVKGEGFNKAGQTTNPDYNQDHGYMPGEDAAHYFPHSVQEGWFKKDVFHLVKVYRDKSKAPEIWAKAQHERSAYDVALKANSDRESDDHYFTVYKNGISVTKENLEEGLIGGGTSYVSNAKEWPIIRDRLKDIERKHNVNIETGSNLNSQGASLFFINHNNSDKFHTLKWLGRTKFFGKDWVEFTHKDPNGVKTNFSDRNAFLNHVEDSVKAHNNPSLEESKIVDAVKKRVADAKSAVSNSRPVKGVKELLTLHREAEKRRNLKTQQTAKQKSEHLVATGKKSADDHWKQYRHGSYHAADGHHYDYIRSTDDPKFIHVRRRGSKSPRHETLEVNKNWSNEQAMRHHKGPSHIEHLYSNPETKPKVDLDESFLGGVVGGAIGAGVGSLVGQPGVGGGLGYFVGSQILSRNVRYHSHYTNSKEEHDAKVQSLISRGWKPYTQTSMANSAWPVSAYYSKQYAAGNKVPTIKDMKLSDHHTTLLYKGSNLLTGRTVAMAGVHYPKENVNEAVSDGNVLGYLKLLAGGHVDAAKAGREAGMKAAAKAMKTQPVDPNVDHTHRILANVVKHSPSLQGFLAGRRATKKISTVAEDMGFPSDKPVKPPTIGDKPRRRPAPGGNPINTGGGLAGSGLTPMAEERGPQNSASIMPRRPVRAGFRDGWTSGGKKSSPQPVSEERYIISYVHKGTLKEGATKPWNKLHLAEAQAMAMIQSGLYDDVQILDEGMRHVKAITGAVVGGLTGGLAGLAGGTLGGGPHIGAATGITGAVAGAALRGTSGYREGLQTDIHNARRNHIKAVERFGPNHTASIQAKNHVRNLKDKQLSSLEEEEE